MKKIIIILGVAILGMVIYTLMSDNDDPTAYIQQITKDRKKRDEFMSSSIDSPFRIYGDTTVNLNYFPIDNKYRVMARVELIEKPQMLTLGSSTGEPVKYQKYAYLHFKLHDEKLKLLVLKQVGMPHAPLFTAFADETSAEETYGGGRYLDLDFKRANRLYLDFNKAYNPYCNYNETYSCPFPPAENILTVRIEAGEKDYKK